MKKYLLVIVALFITLFGAKAQNCSDQQIFTWEGASKGNKAKWNTDDTLNIYQDIYGIDVGVKIIDPHLQNTTTLNPSVFNDFTKTNTFFGKGSLVFQITAEKPRQDVCLEFSFSKPIIMQNFTVWDIDYIADLRHPSGNYQDYIVLSAMRKEVDVPLYIYAINETPNFIIEGQTIVSHYYPGLRNDLHHNNPDGAVSLSSDDYIDKFTLCYSNGPADGGPSNGQAMKITEFSFCQKLGTLMGYTLEKITNEPVPYVHLTIENIDGSLALDFSGQRFETLSDENGFYIIEGVPLGNYRVVQTTPDGFRLMSNMYEEVQGFNKVDITYDDIKRENLNFYYEQESPLSIDLKYWNVENIGKQAKIFWQTSSENQSDYYTISVSHDGIHFIDIDRVVAKGNTEALSIYEYFMDHPFNSTYFVKLSHRDFDGTINEIGIKKVSLSSQQIWSVYPNPSSHLLNLKCYSEIKDNYKATIYDVMGKPQLVFTVNNMEESVDVSNLTEGVYTIFLTNVMEQSIVKFIKK